MIMINDKQYQEARAKAVSWLNKSPLKRNFSEGVEILTNMRYKPMLAMKLRVHGNKSDLMRNTLSMAIRDAISFFRDQPADYQEDDVPVDITNIEEGAKESVANEAHEAEVAKSDSDDTEKFKAMPIAIQTLTKDYATAFNKRAALHHQLLNIGENNDQASMDARKELAAKIDALTDYMDDLYPLRREWEATKQIPSMDALQNIKNKYLAVKDKPIQKDEDLAEALQESSFRKKDEDFDAMTREQLMKRRHVIRTHLTKKQNLLKYQTERKQVKENPMPDSPKRTKLETQVRLLENKLYLLEKAKARLG
jgi:hypothetical protein